MIERIKGGLTVDIMGAHAFLPGSQMDLRPVRNLDNVKGQEIEVAIIKLNKKRGNIVVSRKQLLEEEQNEKKAKTLSIWKKARSSPAWSKTSPSTARSSTWVESMAYCTSPTCHGDGSLIPRTWSMWAIRSR